MPALDEHGRAQTCSKTSRDFLGRGPISDRIMPGENGEFRGVRGDHVRAAEQAVQCTLRGWIKQPVTAGSDHDWIDHDVYGMLPLEPFAHGMDHVDVAEHADLDRIDS